MYARLTKIRIDVEKFDEASDLFQKSVAPAFKEQRGYKGIYFMANRDEGACLCLSLWETEEDLVANEQSLSYQEQLIKFMNLYTTSPLREGYEVVFQD